MHMYVHNFVLYITFWILINSILVVVYTDTSSNDPLILSPLFLYVACHSIVVVSTRTLYIGVYGDIPEPGVSLYQSAVVLQPISAGSVQPDDTIVSTMYVNRMSSSMSIDSRM